MKIFALSVAAVFLVSCKSDENTGNPQAPEPEEQKISHSKDIAELLNQKRTLTKKLDRLVATSKLDPNDTLKPIMAEKQQAIVNLQTIRQTHPSLQKLNKELSFWQSNQLSARSSKRPAEMEQASAKIIEISTKIQKLTRELPAIREAEDRITRSEKQIQDLRRSIAENTPEGQKIVSQIEDIEAKIKSLQ